MHLEGLRFLFFFISILGEVVAIGEDGPVLAVSGAELSPFKALMDSPHDKGRSALQLACEREEVTRPLEDWQSWEGLVKGEYASDVILLGWLPGHTRHAVAIDLGEGPGIQNDRGQQTLTNCKVAWGE